jgi:hypothetical protein
MRMSVTKSLIWAPSSLLLALSVGTARADEPKKVGEPRMLAEPGEITDVVDAFDGDDVFDLHLTIGYQYTNRHVNIRRETNIARDDQLPRAQTLSAGGFVASNMNVASYSETTSRLNTRLDVGLYHDIAVFFRLPIILADNRQLDDLNGSAGAQRTVLAGVSRDDTLFRLPFKSPQRSGIDYLAVGADFGFMNQYRDPGKPTWVFGIEGRFSIGEPMHACSAGPPESCAYPSDINRNGVSGEYPSPAGGGSLEGAFQGGRQPGVSRGTNGLELHSYISKRVKYIEPYAGFRALLEFQQERSDYGISDLKGSLVNHPPFEGWGIFGMEVIPWEQRESFQRITLDTRFAMSYRTEGRDYSPLFDALGSSSSLSLRMPNYGGYIPYTPPPPVTPSSPSSQVDPNAQKVYFTGLTDVQQFATFAGSFSVAWQAAEYVKFQAGVGYMREQSHLITTDQPCNPNPGFKVSSGEAGPCVTAGGSAPTGIPNPNFRAAVNTVGHRFRADDGSVWNAWLNAVVMF